jgi:hypothetical protein
MLETYYQECCYKDFPCKEMTNFLKIACTNLAALKWSFPQLSENTLGGHTVPVFTDLLVIAFICNNHDVWFYTE